MSIGIIIAGLLCLILFLAASMPSSRRGHRALERQQEQDATNCSFADLFNVILNRDSEVYFSQQREKTRIEEALWGLKKEATDVAVGKRLNEQDKAENDFDRKMIEDTNRQNIREIDITRKIALHEVDKAAEEVKRQQFMLHLDKSFWKIAQAEKELAMAEYFFKKYRTLEIKEIQLIHKENRLELKRDRDYLANLWDKAEIKEHRIQLREDALKLLTREGVLKVRESEYKFLELKALKYLGYASMDEYYERLRTLDNLSRQYGYNSVTNFGANMLEYGELRDLRNYKNKYLDLKAALEAAKEDSEQKKLT
ncbi:MAG: hypothetical protein ACK4TA_12685 [Saprospiraceae bacterium]